MIPRNMLIFKDVTKSVIFIEMHTEVRRSKMTISGICIKAL